MPTHTERRTPRRATLSLPLAGALLAVTAGSALAQSPSTAPIGAITHPTGSTDIVLSMETGGGFVPFGYLLSQAPTFVLYGDNTVIFRPSDVPTDGTAYAPFVEAHLSNEQVDALLTYALSVGGLANAADSYTDMLITDAPTTVFTIDAAGIDKAVSVYALGIVDPEGPDAEAYAAFEDLATLLSTFEQQVEKGNVLSAELYQPEQYRVVLSEVDASQVDAASGSALAWPWADLAPADFTAFPQNAAWSYAGLTPEQLAAITTVPSGGGLDAYVTSPDGSTTYQVFWRPLLPGEDVAPDTMAGGKGF
jgi:hypothetical protein